MSLTLRNNCRWTSSDLIRTIQTSNILNSKIKLPLYTRSELREIDMGYLHFHNWEETKATFPEFYDKWIQQEDDIPYPNGECGKDVINRIYPILIEISQSHKNDIIVVTHGGIIRTITSHIVGLNLAKRINLPVDNCGITTIEYDGKYKVISINDTSHFENAK